MIRGVLLVTAAFALTAARSDSQLLADKYQPQLCIVPVDPPKADEESDDDEEDGYWVDGGTG